MKKVKIMLTAVIVLGTVGGVLAYKAKRVNPICTTATVNLTCPPVPRQCGSLAVIGKVDPSGAPVCTTTPDASGSCNKPCPVFALTTKD